MLTKRYKLSQFITFVVVGCFFVASSVTADNSSIDQDTILFNDAHFHLTNYVQEGLTAQEFLTLMGDKVGRATLSGLPLQQKWDYFISEDRAPDYYLLTSASLYYYSFVDAVIAEEYHRLSPQDQQRLDPMITGFNPTDMYAKDHILRVLKLYPGVFSGIGEFSVHKEFVSPKITGHAASLHNKALDQIFALAGEIGLITIIHSDINTVRHSGGDRTAHFDDLKELLLGHPDTITIWAHFGGLGRFVKPTPNHLDLLREMLEDPRLNHVFIDLSWDEVAQHISHDPVMTHAWADIITEYPDRFLFGTDAVAPKDQQHYLVPYYALQSVWDLLDETTLSIVSKRNYEHLFDTANKRVRAWEAQHDLSAL